jgi:hypothetical protein
MHFLILPNSHANAALVVRNPPMELLSLSWKRSQEESEVGITSRKIRKEENIEGEKNHGKKKKPSLRRTSIIHHPSANSE